MEGFGYIGQAGTGKTTQLIKKIEAYIDFDLWPESASVLAITFMHGSRRRLESKLKSIQHRGIRVSCQTIDSFCLNIFQRYRSYLGINSSIVVSDNPDELYVLEKNLHIGIHRIREMAIQLLKYTIVREILSFSYPVMVVDEFQDCDGALLEIVKWLSVCGVLFVAADDFQKLDNSSDCPATEWLSQTLELNNLEQIWRTKDGNILDSAKALRTNNPTRNGVEVIFAPTKDLAAYTILSKMQWYDKMGSGGRTVAIISPVGSQSDPFVRQTLERLHEPMERRPTKLKKGYALQARPYQIERGEKITSRDILSKCSGWDSIEIVTQNHIDNWIFENQPGFDIGVKRAKRLMKLRNVQQLSKIEFSTLISSGIHFADTFITRKRNNRIFLTIHGAKNREFDDVFILWPMYTLPPGELYLRKLMYNAITRARRKVVLIIQGQKERQSECPLNLIIV